MNLSHHQNRIPREVVNLSSLEVYKKEWIWYLRTSLPSFSMWHRQIPAKCGSWKEFQSCVSSRTLWMGQRHKLLTQLFFLCSCNFNNVRIMKLMNKSIILSLKCRWQLWLQQSHVLKDIQGAAALFHIFQTPVLPAVERDLCWLIVWENKDINSKEFTTSNSVPEDLPCAQTPL